MVIIDGDEGLVVLDPDAADAGSATARPPPSGPRGSRGWPAWPTCPPRPSTESPVGLWGNIEFPAEVAACLERGAAGVGLYRTEFLFLNGDRPPTEEEQFEAYAAVVRSLARPPGHDPDPRPRGRQAGRRTRTPGYAEPNPALGLRSLRLSLRDPACSGPSSGRSSGPAPWATSG